jgi:hypothetical protein
MRVQRTAGGSLAIGVLALVWSSCDFLRPTGIDAPETRLHVLNWPDTLVAGDSAVARVEVLDSIGKPVAATTYRWEIDPVETAGLHGTGNDNERQVLAFRPGKARLRVRATWRYCSDEIHCNQVPVTDGDSTRPIMVISSGEVEGDRSLPGGR